MRNQSRSSVDTFPCVSSFKDGERSHRFWVKAHARDRGVISRDTFSSEDGAMNAGIQYLKYFKERGNA